MKIFRIKNSTLEFFIVEAFFGPNIYSVLEFIKKLKYNSFSAAKN